MSYSSNIQKKTYIRPTICVFSIEDTHMICHTASTTSVRIKTGSADGTPCYSRERSIEVSDDEIGFGSLWN